MKPLANLKVLDLTRVLSGPYCTSILVENGADVIKVEPPAGDDYRHIGPFTKEGPSALFEKVNAGKRSIMLDLARDDDRTIALYARHTTGIGKHLDISMLEGMLQLQPLVAARLHTTGKTPTRVGNRHPLSAPFGMFAAKVPDAKQA